jgi:transcriptional regulator with PAS, ATPase and Fis domain/uncharacterized protein HemY
VIVKITKTSALMSGQFFYLTPKKENQLSITEGREMRKDKNSKQKDIDKLIKKCNNNMDKPIQQRIAGWQEVLTKAESLKDLNSIAIAADKLAALHFDTQNFEKVIEFCKQAIMIYNDVGNTKRSLTLELNIGVCYLQLNKFLKAIEHFQTMINTKGPTNKILIDTNKYTGLAYFYLSKYSEALKYYEKALKLSHIEEDSVHLAGLYNMIGMLHKSLGEYAKALEFLILSSEMKDRLQDKKSYAHNMNNIGAIYVEWNNNVKALEYYQNALDIYDELGMENQIASTLTNIGSILKQKKEYDKALKYFNKAIKISKSINDNFTVASTLQNIGLLYSEKGDEEKAISFMKEALDYKRKIGNQEGVIIGLLNISDSFLKLGNTDEALKYALECLKISEDISSDKWKDKTYFTLAHTYKKQCKYKKSLDYYVLYSELKDKIFSEDSSQKIAEMQTKYETEKKEKEAELEHTRAENLKLKNIELKEKNELIVKQKQELQESIDKLHQSEIKYNFVAHELNRSIGTTLIGESEAIKNIIELISTVARSESTNVLITGESGTGKEIIARNIHEFSKRNKKNFYAVNSSAIPDTLFESQFFGHEKNAFTGATSSKIGWFEIADKSTLFLDEIGTMSIEQQVKLLRALEERKIVRLGSHNEIDVDVRIISATNINLLEFMKDNKFRRDLYHRLATFVINIPVLKDRKEDIPLLLRHFVKMFSRTLNKRISRIDSKVDAALADYDFPGNVRELKNMVERAVLISDSSVLRLDSFVIPRSESEINCFKDIVPLEEMEKMLITKALKATNFNRVKAAKLLEIERKAVERRMKKYGIKQ